jgi:uncharacterized protein (DUF58 family)
MVRQFEQQANQDFVVLLSLWQPLQPGVCDRQHIETAVSLAATIAADVCRRGGCRMKLGIGTKEPSWLDGPASTALYDEAMRRLAIANSSAEDGLDTLLAKAVATSAPGAQIVVVSPRSVDLYDTNQFAAAQAATPKHGWESRVLVLDTSSRQLDDFFHAPETGRRAAT